MKMSETARPPREPPSKRGSRSRKDVATPSASRARTPKKPAKQSEKCLHLHCIQWVQKAHPDLLIFHVANERKATIGAAMHFKRMGVVAGVADLLAFDGGRCYAIELKDDKGKQTAEQRAFAARWVKAGHTYFVVRTLEQFQGVIYAIRLWSPRSH